MDAPSGLSIAQAIRYFVNAISAVKAYEDSQKTFLDKLTNIEIIKTYSNLKIDTQKEKDTPEELTAELASKEPKPEEARKD